MKDLDLKAANAGKFVDPFVTADGADRAVVPLEQPRTLWFNTGTLCNIECVNCYILSSPTNDDLVYLTAEEVTGYLDQLQERQWPVTEIGFTGGEPFMNPDIIAMLRTTLERGFEALVLTNAMQPMMRKRVQAGLLELREQFGDNLTLRVSLDHYEAERHDQERGRGSFEHSLKGMHWLRFNRIRMAVAGRIEWHADEAASRAGYGAFFDDNGFDIPADDPARTVLFPEMDMSVEVPEITTACWDILNKSPADVMCASSRMVIKRMGDDSPSVAACTLLPYEQDFVLGTTLAEAERPVALNHPHCAKFCVLGGASCSA